MAPMAWLDSEPIRTRVYPVLVVVAGYLAVKGVLDSDTASLVLGLAAALVGGVATEAGRARVSPIAGGNGGGRHAAPREPQA